MARQSLVRTDRESLTAEIPTDQWITPVARRTAVLALCAAITGVNVVLAVSSTRQLVAAFDERAQVERISVHLHGLFANCKDH